MKWSELKSSIYYWDGSCRDICVTGAGLDGWEAWVSYINKCYPIRWFNAQNGREECKVDFAVLEQYWAGNEALFSMAKVFIENIQVNTYFLGTKELVNDIDPREFTCIEDHNRLIDYMKALSTVLNKVVVLTPENEHSKILIKVNCENIRYY